MNNLNKYINKLENHKLEDHQKKIQSDLEEIKKLPDEFARIDIPNVEDDLSNLFTSLASF